MSYLVIGLAGCELSNAERQILHRPELAGVILFSRNCASPEQVRRLTDHIRQANASLVVFIDQEGGRVQRVREPLTVLPPLGAIGQLYDLDPDSALAASAAHGELMALEVLSLGIDVSLAPVLDLDAGSAVIGDRAFHARPPVVIELATAYVSGMHAAGMAACGKHFPGHGSVLPDTHHEVAVDDRTRSALDDSDLLPFGALVRRGIDALMMAHVCYSQVCELPAGYSTRWIGDILRRQLGFTGVVLSDDLGMRAAHCAGNFADRTQASLQAGCDLVLICQADDVSEALAGPALPRPHTTGNAAAPLQANIEMNWPDLSSSERCENLRELLGSQNLLAQGAAH